jgi:antitoxin (DNA-binding transcriptional repressor) of toxin-antitoxin stability system
MDTTAVELRYRTKDVLEALERGENVKIFYHGQMKGEIVPFVKGSSRRVADHSFFGMHRGDVRSVADIMTHLRQGRVYAV